ncbi:MAG: histidine phosphatase family protein [Pseudomonadales bacterium]|nr:histidine phosphatase family protein [Pseudomonadales bacterium]
MLNKNGLRQAYLLRGYLSQYNFNQIWVSPLPRAKQTIQPYLESELLKCILLPELVEGCYNLDHTAPINERWELGLDPLGDFRGRVKAIVSRVKNMIGDGEILVVTHGHFIREFLNMLVDSHSYLRWPIGNCAETALDVDEDIKVLYVNRTVI